MNSAEALVAERRAWQTERESLWERASQMPARVSPSKLAGEVEHRAEEAVEQKREQAQLFGTIVHDALEQMETSIITRSALEPADKKRALEMVERALQSDLLQRVQSAEQVYREVPFALMTNDGLMEGKIDLLFCENGKWILVDYKTDACVEIDRYRQQLGAYETALKQVAGIVLAEKLLFFLATGKVEPVDS